MKQVTLRFPQVGYERLRRMCDRYGITIRAAFEASALLALEDEQDPERHDLQIMMWDTVAILEASEEFRVPPLHTLVITLEDDLHAQAQDACRRFGVSLNAAFALVVMPWPLESPPECVEFRTGNVRRIVHRARRLDSLRGRGRYAGVPSIRQQSIWQQLGGVVPECEWQDAIARVEDAANTTHAAIEQLLDLLRLGLKERQDGGMRPEIVKRIIANGGVEARRAMEAACGDLERAMHAYRGAAVRVLVDEGGMSFSECVALFDVSRQMIARLYRGTEE